MKRMRYIFVFYTYSDVSGGGMGGGGVNSAEWEEINNINNNLFNQKKKKRMWFKDWNVEVRRKNYIKKRK